eukprot:gene7983-1202_t
MKANYNLAVEGSIAYLVPYREAHVPKYHEWMADPEIQKLTASEPLSLEEEYAMQKSWAEDEDKCTFIVYDKTANASEDPGNKGAMAGDVNIFFNEPEDRGTAEIEIMIAEPQSRRKGIAVETLQMFMAYAAAELGVKCFRAKILDDNEPSIKLFQNRLGFAEVKRVPIFSVSCMQWLGLVVMLISVVG